jgi:mono/diheme cytochrome c family protein
MSSILIGCFVGFIAWFLTRYLAAGLYTVNQNEGPNLHGLKKSDEWIARRIRNGVKGEMRAFGEKFSQTDIEALIAYLRTLK